MAIMQIWVAREGGRGVFYRDRFHDSAAIWRERGRQKVSAEASS